MNKVSYIKAIFEVAKDLACDEYGRPINVDYADKVFEDIYGIQDFITKIAATNNLSSLTKVIERIGTDRIITLMQNDNYLSTIRELINTLARIQYIEKRAKKLDKKKDKASNKDKNKIEKQYSKYIKELKYAKPLYKNVIKELRKSLGIKKNDKEYKSFYSNLKSFTKRDEWDNEFDWDCQRIFDNDVEYDDDNNSYFMNLVNSRKKIKYNPKYKNKFNTFDDDDELDLKDDYDDEDDDDENEEIAKLKSKISALESLLSPEYKQPSSSNDSNNNDIAIKYIVDRIKQQDNVLQDVINKINNISTVDIKDEDESDIEETSNVKFELDDSIVNHLNQINNDIDSEYVNERINLMNASEQFKRLAKQYNQINTQDSNISTSNILSNESSNLLNIPTQWEIQNNSINKDKDKELIIDMVKKRDNETIDVNSNNIILNNNTNETDT